MDTNADSCYISGIQLEEINKKGYFVDENDDLADERCAFNEDDDLDTAWEIDHPTGGSRMPLDSDDQ